MKKYCTAASIALCALTASAQDFYVGAGAGMAVVRNNLNEFNSLMVNELGGTISSSQDKSVSNMRLIGGFKFNEHVSLEIGYMRSSKFNLNFSGQSGGNVAYSGNGNVSFSGLDISTILRPSVASGYNNFLALLGVHNYKAKTSFSLTANGSAINGSSSDKGTGLMFGAGYDWKLSQDLDARLSIIRLNKIAGESEQKATNYGLTLIKKF